MFPTTISTSLNESLRSFKTSPTLLEWACAVSTTIASTPDLISCCALFLYSLSVPIAAETINLPYLSLFEVGFSECLFISLNVIRPMSIPFESTTGNFSIL